MVYSQWLLVLFTVLNSILYLNARFVGTPQSTADLKVILKQSVELKCENEDSNDDSQFTEWYKDNVPVSSDKPGHYVVKKDGKQSTLIIKTFVKADADVRVWSVKTNKPGYENSYACRFDSIQLKSAPLGIQADRPNEKIDGPEGSIRRNEDESVSLKCLIEPPDVTALNKLRWEFSKDDHKFSSLPAGVTVTNSELIINQIKKAHRGYYRCEYNDVKFTVLLRVKDRLAALWPFIGIVTAVLVLVIVILIFEKRQKANKKTTIIDDDEQDQADDPLVRTTTKGSDNDGKKRAIKA